LIDLNPKSYKRIEELYCSTSQKLSLSGPEMLQEYFTELITHGKGASARRTLTI
jgi:hypothetical protein